MTINAIFPDTYNGYDYGLGSVVSLSGNAEAQASMQRAANAIASQFSDNQTVNILFYGAHGGDINSSPYIASSVGEDNYEDYATYTARLAADSAAHPGNSVLASAVANLGSGNGAADPGNTAIIAALPQLRVLGDPAPYTNPIYDATGAVTLGSDGWGAGNVDGMVFLNVDLNQVYTRPVPGPDTGYADDAQSSAEHEIDEVLGIGGGGSTLDNLADDPTFAQDCCGYDQAYGAMDLYRYSAPGVPSYTTDFGANAYFSIDGGKTSTEIFNDYFSEYGGDAGDWGIDPSLICADGYAEGTGHVQDAYGCENSAPDFTRGGPEYIALEAIGYNAVPEPATWGLMLTGFGVLGAALRGRRGVRLAAAHA